MAINFFNSNLNWIFFLEHAGELRIFVLRGKRVGPITIDSTSPWTRVRAANSVDCYKKRA